MTYPKEVMRISELMQLGFSKRYLMGVFRLRNQKIAWKQNPSRNSPIYFSTPDLEKYRQAQCAGGRGV